MARSDGPEAAEERLTADEVAALREELTLAKRQALVGRLAGTLAHDFNNVLTAVLGFAEMLLADAEADHPWRPDLKEIFDSGQRAALLTRRLLAFNRQVGNSPQLLSLAGLVVELEPLLRALVGEAVPLEIDSEGAHDLEVLVDKGHASEVLFTLGWLARTAVTRGRCRFEVTGAIANASQQVTQEIRFSLSTPDVGFVAGTADEVAAGLRQIDRVVAQAGGVFSAEVTTTALRAVARFPVESGFVAAEAPAPAFARPAALTAMLAEDEELLRQVVRRMLERSGVSVIEAASGEEALSQIEQRSVPLDLLVTDIVMPGMNGIELAERVLARAPRTRVLYVSGYIDAASIDLAKPGVRATFLPKPFTRDQLLAAIDSLFA